MPLECRDVFLEDGKKSIHLRNSTSGLLTLVFGNTQIKTVVTAQSSKAATAGAKSQNKNAVKIQTPKYTLVLKAFDVGFPGIASRISLKEVRHTQNRCVTPENNHKHGATKTTVKNL